MRPLFFASAAPMTPAGRAHVGGDGMDPWGFANSVDASLVTLSTFNEVYGDILTVESDDTPATYFDFQDYYDTLIARGVTPTGTGVDPNVLALKDCVYISEFADAADATAGTFTIANATPTSLVLLVSSTTDYSDIAYNAGTAYDVGDRVFYQDRIYIATRAGTGNAPSGSTSESKYWRYLYDGLAFQGAIVDLTGMVVLTFGYGPLLHLSAADGTGSAGDIFVCGDPSGTFEVSSTANGTFAKTVGYGSRLTPNTLRGADWFGQLQPGNADVNATMTVVRPTTSMTATTNLVSLNPSSTDHLHITGLHFKGDDVLGTKRAQRLLDNAVNNSTYLTVSNCKFSDNTGTQGALRSNTKPTLVSDCVFEGCNDVGIYIDSGAPFRITDTLVTGTIDAGKGHGIYHTSNVDCTVTNSQLVDNEGAGFLSAAGAVLTLINISHTTVSGNADSGIDLSGNTLTGITANYIHHNSITNNGDYAIKLPATGAVNFLDANHTNGNTTAKTNLTNNILPGVANTDGDPLYTDPDAGNYIPLKSSPLVDESNNNFKGAKPLSPLASRTGRLLLRL